MTEQELELEKKRLDIENQDKRADQQRRIVWIAVSIIIIVTLLLMSPFVDVERAATLSNMIEMFYITQAGIIMAFFGAQALMTRNK